MENIKKKYGALRIIVSIITIIGVLFIGGGLITIVKSFVDETGEGSFFAGIGLIAGGVIIIAHGEFIKVFIDIEENTRSTNLILKQNNGSTVAPEKEKVESNNIGQDVKKDSSKPTEVEDSSDIKELSKSLKNDEIIVRVKGDNSLKIIKKSKYELDKELRTKRNYEVVYYNNWDSATLFFIIQRKTS